MNEHYLTTTGCLKYTFVLQPVIETGRTVFIIGNDGYHLKLFDKEQHLNILLLITKK